jgi:hypothetical protein
MACLAAATSAAAADPIPCQVLTEADVKGVLGVDWQAFPSMSKTDACAYRGSGGKLVTLVLTEDSSAAASMLGTRRQMAGNKAKPAAGPGVGAFRLDTPMANAIVFGRGKWVAQIDVAPPTASDAGILDRLAQMAYDRLP